MSYTQQQLDDLKAAIASGSTSIWHEGRRVTYRSLDEMIQIQGLMERELGLASAPRTHAYGSFDKGIR